MAIKYVLFFILFFVYSDHVTATQPKGTCVPPSPNVVTILNMLSSIPNCKFSPYDVSQITMSVLSPQSLSVDAIQQITTTDEFAALGCCGKPTLFTHHGWLQSNETSWNPQLQLQFASATQGCAVAFDYNQAALENYACTVLQNNDNIANECARLVYQTFIEPGCLAPEYIVYMGFSYGARIATQNAYQIISTYNSSVGTIFSMDPSGPIYDTDPKALFYYREVAKTVPKLQCVYTSYLFGSSKDDWCPSNIHTGDCTRGQSDCQSATIPGACDHGIAPSFLIDSYKYPGNIVAKKCSTCPWGLPFTGLFQQCKAAVDTDVLGYKSQFKQGEYWYNDPTRCINVYNI